MAEPGQKGHFQDISAFYGRPEVGYGMRPVGRRRSRGKFYPPRLVQWEWFMARRAIGLAAITASTLLLAGCGSSWFGDPVDTSQTDTDAARRAADPYHTNPLYNPNVPAAQVYINKQENGDENSFSVLTSLFSNDKGKGGGGGGMAGVAVNSYLWHASLDTMSFMPIASADPFGGTIITDWYSPRGTPSERFKVNIFILNRELRADGVRVTVFRQTKDGAGQWVDAPVDPKTGRDLENSILMRARQIRLSTASTS
jgi:hypothetical protein